MKTRTCHHEIANSPAAKERARRTAFVLMSLIGFGAISTQSHAAEFCRGRITHILVDALGSTVIVPTFRDDWLQICNVLQPWKGISADLCRSWKALAKTLRVAQEFETLYYADSTPCNLLPTYGDAPAPATCRLSNPSGARDSRANGEIRLSAAVLHQAPWAVGNPA